MNADPTCSALIEIKGLSAYIALGQRRRFGSRPTTSDGALEMDIVTAGRHVKRCQQRSHSHDTQRREVSGCERACRCGVVGFLPELDGLGYD